MYKKIIIMFILSVLVVSCKDKSSEPDKESVLLSAIHQEADIVTTELTIRKIAIYDSDKTEKISLRDPNTWKFGSRKCVVPVSINIKYGYDIRDIKLESIRIDDSSKIIHIKLPEAKVIDSGYNTDTESGNIVCISTGLRSAVGHEMIETISRKAYKEVLKKGEFKEIAEKDIRNNAKMIFDSLAKSLGYNGVEIE